MADARPPQGFFTVGGNLGREPVGAQALLEESGDAWFIFGDEDTAQGSSTSSA
jgi:hypothetical protein